MNYHSSPQVPFQNFGYPAFQTTPQDSRISPLGLGLGAGALSLGMGGGFAAPFVVGTATGAVLQGGFNSPAYYGGGYYPQQPYQMPYYNNGYNYAYSQQGYNMNYGQQPVYYAPGGTPGVMSY